jgi:hypothetical protein
LIERLQITIPEAERTGLQVQIMRIVLREDYAQLPLYWYVTPRAFAKGVTGLVDVQGGPHGLAWDPWNAHLWDKQ